MARVTQIVKRHALVGGGVFGSTFVGDAIDDFVPGGDLAVAGGEIGVGLGLTLAPELLGGRGGSLGTVVDILDREEVEFVGYGIGGAGAAEAADMIQTGALADKTISFQTGQQASSSGGGSSSSQSTTQTTQSRQGSRESFEVSLG